MILKLALRNIFRQKRRTVFTVLTMVGGFTLASLSIGIADGSYNHLIDVFTRTQTGHIQIHKGDYLDKPSLYKTIDGYQDVGNKIETVRGVESWAPQLFAPGLASLNDKSSAVQMIGIDPRRETATTHFDKKIKQGILFPEQPGHFAVIGKGLAQSLKADLDSQIVIVSQAADGSIANDIYTVCGIMESGDDYKDRMSFYLHLADAQELMVLEGRVHQISINVSNIKKVPGITRRLSQELSGMGLDVEPWQVVAKTFYRSMQADKQGNVVFHFIIMLIVAIGVLNTVLMAVLERTREYGVLKALGTRPSQIFRMVVIEVMAMAAISLVIGSLLGLLVNYIFSIYGFNIPPTEVGGIVMDTMKSEINAPSIYIPTLLVFFSALLVCIFPARMASKIQPARAMRLH
ncbi:MAG: FtsX-like permease family protein [Candidatus Edwardsbacteria bacterium]|nr:FtsX-like permease family protein [Candidatus Edwardsbacteria bacterium]MBU1575672.1 FtsX-like permease family protein [Candidatus Edwardsbacteria bacterium]MBU2463763.1 FtsX-like permease family protein [Candidatus Edwardsbacteria bacterium]MBU2594064.1 FtsX-like permease family protein [Candidatus Edwardsbacteria bacterium]